MEELLREVLGKLDIMQNDISEIKSDIVELKSDVAQLKSDVTQLKSDVARIDKKLDAVHEQVADLTEFKSQTTETLNKVSNDFDFWINRTIENEKQMFLINKKMSVFR